MSTPPIAFHNAHILAVGVLFALWDAFGIGANDVANAFSTSVNAGCFTMAQVGVVAMIMEFLGAITAGGQVSSTIQRGILAASRFTGQEGLLQLGMLCALIASSTWLQLANYMAWPVSTTHSIVGAVMGIGVATFGGSGVEFGFCGDMTPSSSDVYLPNGKMNWKRTVYGDPANGIEYQPLRASGSMAAPGVAGYNGSYVYIAPPTTCSGTTGWAPGKACRGAPTCFSGPAIPGIMVNAAGSATQGSVLYSNAAPGCASPHAGEMHFTGSYMGYRPEYRQVDGRNALREGPAYWADLTMGEKGMATTAFCMASRVKKIKGEALTAIPGSGFAPIAISWIVSPIAAGILAATMFAITKYTILDDNVFTKLIYGKGDEEENSFFRALILAPVLYGFVAAVLVVLLAFKGVSTSGTVNDLATIANAPASLAVAAGVTGVVIFVLAIGWVSYWQYRVNWVGEDLKWYHWLIAPFAPKQPIREGFDTSHKTATLTLRTEAASTDQGIVAVLDINAVLAPNMDTEAAAEKCRLANADPAEIEAARKVPGYVIHKKTETELVWESITKPIFEGPIASRVAAALLLPLRMTFTFGIFAADGKERVVREYKADTEQVMTMHKAAKKYSDRTELVFRQLQIITSCIAAFSHGANDVANAMGPLSTILGVYRCNRNVPGAGAACVSPIKVEAGGVWSTTGEKIWYSATDGWETPLWLLAVGGIMLGIGFTSYGYNLLRSLGNNLTYHSPSRCYCMEFGAAIIVLLASRIGLPISTTQCITGATMAVGLMNGASGVNWVRFSTIFGSWLVTMPFVGIYSGLLYAFMASNPSLKNPTQI